MNSFFGSFDTEYSEAAMKFFYPKASVCYVQIVLATRYVCVLHCGKL